MSTRSLTATSLRPAILVILAIVVLKSLLFFVVLPTYESTLGRSYGLGFADQYDLLALSIVEGNGYRFTPDTAPTLTREPGYPLLLAGLFALFGYGLAAVKAANLLLSAIAAGLIARLARDLWPATRWPVLIAPVLFLLHPGIVIAELRGGVEISFIFLLMCFLSVIWRALKTGRLRDYALAGLVLGLTSLFRSTALLFPVFLLGYFLLFDSTRPKLIVAASRIGLVFACAALVLSPWIVRNYALTGRFVPTASVQGIAAHAGNYICRNWSAEKGFRALDREAAAERVDLARQQGYRFDDHYYIYFFDPRDEVRFNGFLGQRVAEQYRESPGLLLKCMSRNLFNFWFAGKNSQATRANLAAQLPYLLLGIAGMLLALRAGDRRLMGLLLLFSVYTMGVYLPIHAQARYSMALVPALAIFAAWPVARLLRLQRSAAQAPHHSGTMTAA